MAESFWLTSPRDGFSTKCQIYFGMSFDGGASALMQLPKSAPKPAAYPSMSDLSLQRTPNRHGRGAGTAISKKALKAGKRLVG